MPNLFGFNLTPTGMPRNWRSVLQKDRFRATLIQTREPGEREDLGEALTIALREAINERILATPNIAPHHAYHFTMQSDLFSHAFQSTTFTVREFQEDSNRLRTYLQSLAEKLNSNEDFEGDDSFMMEMTLIRTPGRGGRGKRDKGRRLGRVAIESLLKTMKARADVEDSKDADYVNLRKGRPIREESPRTTCPSRSSRKSLRYTGITSLSESFTQLSDKSALGRQTSYDNL